jgi:DNA repair exonuclease SbcCD ATPase subunit
MDLQDNYTETNILDRYPKSSMYLNNIKTTQGKIGPILDDFNKYFVFYNMNPQISENQQMYENIKNNIQELYSSLLLNANEINKNVTKINNNYQELNNEIELIKNQNAKLKKQLDPIQDKYDGSDTMINNYKYMYNLQYLKNFSLGLGIAFSLFAVVKLFKQQNINVNTDIS